MNVRERIEKFEIDYLSPYASMSKNSKGRDVPVDECDVRTSYQRDRDRIIHSKAFRRLKHKTQMFIYPAKDHYRTRLTHTLEVTQVARTIARALLLNEDLTEAIALGHDLGHTPFGHEGEYALNKLSPLGFKHYEQSYRIVKKLENMGKGLNLTHEVCNGILYHTTGGPAETMEGRIVKIADRIAYINHDVDDGMRANILLEDDIPKSITDVVGKTRAERIDSFIKSLIENSHEDVLCMSSEVGNAFYELHNFMYQNVYWNTTYRTEEKKIFHFIEALYEHLMKNPDALPQDMKYIIDEDGLDRAVCDYISGMSDSFAVDLFNEVFVPKAWSR